MEGEAGRGRRDKRWREGGKGRNCNWGDNHNWSGPDQTTEETTLINPGPTPRHWFGICRGRKKKECSLAMRFSHHFRFFFCVSFTLEPQSPSLVVTRERGWRRGRRAERKSEGVEDEREGGKRGREWVEEGTGNKARTGTKKENEKKSQGVKVEEPESQKKSEAERNKR